MTLDFSWETHNIPQERLEGNIFSSFLRAARAILIPPVRFAPRPELIFPRGDSPTSLFEGTFAWRQDSPPVTQSGHKGSPRWMNFDVNSGTLQGRPAHLLWAPMHNTWPDWREAILPPLYFLSWYRIFFCLFPRFTGSFGNACVFLTIALSHTQN